MTFSPARAGVFAMIGLPIGFIVAGLTFAILSLEITAPTLAPVALPLALAIGIFAGIDRRKS